MNAFDAVAGSPNGKRRRSETNSTASDAAGLKESEMEVRQLLLLSAAMLAIGAPGFAQGDKEPSVCVAEIETNLAQLDAYKTAVKEQVEAALRLEPGVLALYSVADKENPTHVTVFEIYADVGAYKAHLETAHFKNYSQHPGHGEVPPASRDGTYPPRRQKKVIASRSNGF